MDQGQLREQEARCVQDEAPWCTASCPVHVDARALLGHASRGNFDAAFAELKRRVPFPGTIARVCDAPCRPDCKRKEAGGAIEIHQIEAACADFASPSGPTVLSHLPKTGKSVAVIGGGLSGLTAAYDLAKKGHRVVLFEAQSQVGGRLLLLPGTHLPQSVLHQELEIVSSLGVEIQLGRRIEASDEASLLEEFSAVYQGTGADPALPEGPLTADPATFALRKAVFAGGGAVRGTGALSFIGSVSDGRRAAISIDRFLQGVSLTAGRDKEGRYETRLYTSLAEVTESPPVPARNPSGYDRAEAQAEAGRCLQCECLECVKVCEYLRHYGSYPKRYVREVYNNLSIVMGMRKSNEFIDSCSLCGLCGQVCPTGLNMAEINLEARRMMTEAGKMPPSAFDFALRDLAFSTGPEFFLAKGQPGHNKSAYLFFPGCQLCASLPYQVERVYSDLREGLGGGVALVLGCCGAPAQWSGQENLADSVAQHVAAQWQSWGRPTIIAGCPTCRRTLAGKIPGAKVENLLEVLERISLIIMAHPRAPDGKAVAIHDACTAREDDSLHACVRRTLAHLGYPVTELPTSGRTAECCGYGGLMYNANRTLAESVTRRRMDQSPLDYVTYCAMCRDRFNAQEKSAFHVLELIYGTDATRPGGSSSPNFSERRENRRRLRQHLLDEVWGEKALPEETSNITHDEAVRKSMEERFILWEDVTEAVRQAEATGRRLRDEASGLFIASHRPGHVTYWVWYEKTAEQLVVRKVYCHRMEILGTQS